MKTFNLKEFNKDGNTFTILTYAFDSEKGLRIGIRSSKVSVRPNIGPCAGCDFNAAGSSMSSKHFYEKKGTIDINDLFFKPEYKYHVKGFVYCLEENTEKVTDLVENQLVSWLHRNLNNVVNEAQKAIKVI